MPDQTHKIVLNLRVSTGDDSSTGTKPLPRLPQTDNRAAGGASDPFVNDWVVKVEAVYELAAPGQGFPRKNS